MILGPRANDLRQELNFLLYDMEKSEQDLVISIFGREGSGKSRWAMNLASLLDSTFNGESLMQKTAQSVRDFGRIAPKTRPFEVCWWDEAHRFSKRSQYDADVNKDLLEYFQDIRGGKKIFLLCFPQIEEIDRKAVDRPRMFFETIKQGGKFFVKAWTHDQIDIKVRQLRLPSPITRAKLWVGTSKKPKAIFSHDARGIEDVIETYKDFKASSIKRTDEKLALKYGYRNTMDISVAVWNELKKVNIEITFKWLQELAGFKLTDKLENGWDIQKAGSKWRVYNDDVFDKIVEEITRDVCASSKTNCNSSTDVDYNILHIEQNTPEIKQNEVILLAQH